MLRKERADLLAAEERKHCLDRSDEKERRLNTEHRAFNEKIEKLHAERLAIELADDDELQRPAIHAKAAPTAPPAPWEINPAHRNKPDFPEHAKFGEPAFEVAYDAFQDWGIATVSRVYQDHNIAPNGYVSFRTLAMIIGSQMGMVKFAEVRLHALEQQFAKAAGPLKALADKIEAGEVKPMNYRGTFKAGTAYRPGDMVTHAGSMFHCDRATSSTPEEYGTERAWTLAVKRGKDAGR
ncbi:hypothetical protein ABMA59_28485 [Mesorhizobium sp. CN2-181]